MRYQDEYDAGGIAFYTDEPRSANPHIWHSVEWYAWDAGWTMAEKIETQPA